MRSQVLYRAAQVGQPASLRNLGCITERVRLRKVSAASTISHTSDICGSVEMYIVCSLPWRVPSVVIDCLLDNISLQAGLMTHLCTGTTPWQLQSSMLYKSCCQKTSVISASLAWITTTCCLLLMWTNCSQQISAA